MRILVTGAEGFIGSHLTEALVRGGHDVRAFVWYNAFDSRGWLDACACDVHDEFEVFAGDIRDRTACDEAVRGCEVILHLAALIGIPYSYRAAQSYVETNVIGTLNLLEAARRHGIRRMIHTSTSEVYGTALAVPIAEDHPLQAQSPYSASKIAADQMALSYHRSFDLPVVVIRPFNTFGPRQSARAVIPTIVTQLLAGKDVSLGALHPTRDFCYVADTVAGFVAATVADSIVGEVVNLGSGFEISIGDLAALLAEIVGAESRVVADETRLRPDKSEVERLLADNAKAALLLGWRPAYAGRDGLSRALASTIDWFRDPANRARYRAGHYTV